MKDYRNLVHTCRYIPWSDIVPQWWSTDITTIVFTDAPFSWGDNDKSLIDMDAFVNHVGSRLDDEYEELFSEWKKSLLPIWDIYVDLEP